MWKKPSIEKPDFNKFAIDDLSEKEAFELNGGLNLPNVVIFIPGTKPLSGLVAPPIKIPTYKVPIGTISFEE
jgi:hypothetical protein